MGAVRACRHGCADCAGNEMPLVLGPDFAGLFWRFYDLCMGGSDEHRNPIFGARRTGHPPIWLVSIFDVFYWRRKWKGIQGTCAGDRTAANSRGPLPARDNKGPEGDKKI